MDMQNLLHSTENYVTMETATVSVEQAKVFADHYLALAKYWRKVAKMPPVVTVAGERKRAEAGHR